MLSSKVAIKKMGPNRQNPKLVELPNGKSYYFSPKNNICMAYVDPEDVDAILAIRKSCCGGNRRPIFFLANEADIRRYEYGGR